MSLARGRFGVEYDARGNQDESPGLGWAVVFVVLAAAVSLAVTVVNRVRAIPEGPAEPPPPPLEIVTPAPAATPAGATATSAPPPLEVKPDVFAGVPPKVRNLLMRLGEAEKAGDVVMQISTLEQIRELKADLPPALDADLVRRLGDLNVRWLFELANAQWVETVTVKSGDSATRIAHAHGATLASLRLLNPSLDVERLVIGRSVRVMNHPRFVIRVRAGERTADLWLNDRFFKRYTLRSAVGGKPGSRELEGSVRIFLAENGLWFHASDRTELETLLSRRTTLEIAP